ncbi:hypothetical protein [Mycolicibacter sinensis]|jgi:hypothetical protein|uniref:GP55 protein n=1 Tax=Mycolicibacter sinensis (strain JDM601) TaxID=875328 RepID=A0A1A2EI82_MYCSD|nr:hypothetical protein [Mycolicibacter sinensis]OBG04194.1 hypothetical protein A5771_12180 [Mycolicibacter sinensis]OBG06386.1 hypothetical protein A5772_01725 [Mycolicibacter sinensis]
MTSVFIAATLGVILYSLWVRRDTWWSRWESAATFAIAMEGCSLVLLSPRAGAELSPWLYQWLGMWNVQHLIGGLCLMVAVIANIYHMLVRLADPDQVRPLMRRHLQLPLGAGVLVLLASFVKIERGHEPDMFAGLTGDAWLTAYEVAACGIVLYLSGYVGRLMLALRHDPRAKTTVYLYAASMLLTVVACVIAIVSIGVGSYAGPAIWACICLSVAIFAYGLARSWKAKQAWFSPGASARR